jgi:HK97 family phage portal protein
MSDEEQRVLSDIVWTPERGIATPQETPEVRSIFWNNLLLSEDMYAGRWRTNADVRVTPDTALQSTVFLACCRILAETIATLPLHVYRRLPDGGKELASDIPLYKVLSFAPNSWQTKYEFFEQLVMTLCMWGNSYSQINSGKYGSVSELLNLHPSRMEVERLENGRLRYSYSNPETGRLERYTQDQIMHVRWTAEPDGIKGMVPVEVGREAIALARACEIHAAKFWANSARPGIVLQTDGSLSSEAAERLRDNWERLHRGVDKAYKTAILTNGLKAEAIGFTAEQSQFESTRRFQSEEIARIFRLPLHLIQGQQVGNLETSGREFVTYTLMPWLKRIESAISRSLIYNDDLFFAEFDARALMRGDNNSRAAYYSTMTGLGIFSINDCRKLENLPPLEHGDKHFVAMNMQPLEEAVKPKPAADPMAALMGGGAPPPAQGGVPSLPEVKKGEAPKPAEEGQASEPKPPKEGDLVTWGDGNVGEVKHVMAEGTLDLKSGEKVEVEAGVPVALVHDASGEEHAVEVSKLKRAKESRAVADCEKDDKGRFATGNNCAAEEGADESWKDSDREYTYNNHDPDSGPSPVKGGVNIHGISIEKPQAVHSVMKSIGVETLTDVVGIGGGLARGAGTSVWTAGEEFDRLKVEVQIPIDPEDDDVGFMNSSVTIEKDVSSGESFVYYDALYADTDTGTANVEGVDSKRVSSLLLQVFPESLAAAEKAGLSYASTYAMGDSENEYKGYRLWPKFGFDADLDASIRKSIPKSLGKPRTVQELISTPEGDRWWNENGTSLRMTLDLKDKSSEGYRRYKSSLALARRLKKRNENRAFCPTGEGGGVDNSCAANVDGPSSGAVVADSPSLKQHSQFTSIGNSKNSDNIRAVSDSELIAAMTPKSESSRGSAADKSSKVGAHRTLNEGTPVSLRIDIPTFENHGIYAVTVHQGSGGKSVGRAIGYDSVARLSGDVSFVADEKGAERVATGQSPKFPLATVKGKFSPSRDIPEDIDSWVPVGYDPKKAAYFYDKRTGQEVTGGADALSVGNSVFVRVAEYGKRKAQKHYRNASFWGIESRDDGCVRVDGGRFGPKNTCAADDGGANVTGGGGGGGGSKGPKKPEKLTPDSIPKVSFRKTDDSEAFLAARNKSTRPENFSDIDPERLARSTKFMSEDGTAGCLVDEDGDLGNVFNNGKTPKAGMAAVLTAIESGAQTLDCYDNFLPARYAQVGYIATAKIKWNDDYAPPDWDYTKGRPDVIIMSYQGGPRDTIRERVGSFPMYEPLPDDRYADDFDAAKRTARLSSHPQRRSAGILRQDDRAAGGGSGVFAAGSPQVAGGVHRESVDSLVAETLSRSGSLPKIEVRDIGRAVAYYAAEGDTIYVSPDAERLEDTGWVSQSNPVLHELAHRHHLMADAVSYLSPRLFSPEERSIVEAGVSRYAATNSREFVAEVLSGYWAGIVYGDDVLALLSDFTNGKVTL